MSSRLPVGDTAYTVRGSKHTRLQPCGQAATSLAISSFRCLIGN
jgi:hypothetical protein